MAESSALVPYQESVRVGTPALPGAPGAPAAAPAGASELADLSELLAPPDLSKTLRQGWEPVVEKFGSEHPPPLVGATLTCLQVPSLSKGLDADDLQAAAGDKAQLGLFLFGGDDEDNKQTDLLMIFYLQEHKWRRPLARGRPPSKRSRHTATAVSVPALGPNRQQMLVFGGVGATNAVSLLDPEAIAWDHPPARSKAGEKERARRRAKKGGGGASSDDVERSSESLLPSSRFGHTVGLVGDRLLVFGGADFKGALGDLYELDLAAGQVGTSAEWLVPLEWSRPEPAGLAPPPSAKHCCAVVRDHMLLISGEAAWGGHMWGLQLRPSLMWLRSTLPDFPLLGVSRHALVPFVTPRPHRREELLIFGGVLEGYSHDSEVRRHRHRHHARSQPPSTLIAFPTSLHPRLLTPSPLLLSHRGGLSLGRSHRRARAKTTHTRTSTHPTPLSEPPSPSAPPTSPSAHATP